MRRRVGLGVLLSCVVLVGALTIPTQVHADDGRPAALTLREAPAGTFHVRWQTPVRGHATLRLAPQLPDGSVRQEGSYDRTLLGDALIETWRFSLEGGLEGRAIGVVGGALLSRGVVVIVRASLASGATHRAVLSSRRASFTVPEAVPEARAARWEPLSTAAAAGWDLGLSWIHVLFALLLVAAGGSRALGWPLGAFLAADLFGRFLPVPRGTEGLGLALVGLAAVLLAREALRAKPGRLVGLSLLAGLCHGLTTPQLGGLAETAAHALGVDAAHGVAGVLFIVATGALHTRRLRRSTAAIGGVLACTLAIVAAVEATATAAPAASVPISPMALVDGGRETPSDAAPSTPRRTIEGIELYLDIGVFQTRVEILARLPALARWLEVPPPRDPIDVDAQPAFLERLSTAAREHLTLTVNDGIVEAGDVRAGFTTQDAAGVYLREEAESEPIATAVVGLVLQHATRGMPTSVRVQARGLPTGPTLRARILDPEVTREVPLTATASTVAWTNALREDPLPPVTSLAVQSDPAHVPVLALLVCLAVALGAWRARTLPTGPRLLLLRLALFLLVWLASTGTVEVPALSDATPKPSVRQQRAITATLLDNIYRAFNERGEDEVYDRLALSLTGDQLERAYVENRRILDAQRFGGARAHVDVVELRDFKILASGDEGSFRAAVSWTVAGSVTHFGHRHLRRNRYEAICRIGPEHGTWKIHDFDHHSTERED